MTLKKNGEIKKRGAVMEDLDRLIAEIACKKNLSWKEAEEYYELEFKEEIDVNVD